MLKKIQKVTDWLFNVLIVLSVILIISFIFTKITTGTASFFGYRPLHVMSASMEPTIMTGDYVIGKVVKTEDIRVGGIYTYKNENTFGKTIIHRIYKETDDGSYIFWGDNNPSPDPNEVKPADVTYEVVWYPHKGGSPDA